MLHKNKYGIWTYSTSINGGMKTDNDFKSAADSRPEFAMMDNLKNIQAFHIEYDEDGKKRRIITKRDKDFFNKILDALYDIGVYK